MKKGKPLVINFKTLIYIYLGIFTLIEFIKALLSSEFLNAFAEASGFQYIYFIFLALLQSLLIVFITNFIFIAAFVAKKIAAKHAKKDKLIDIDFGAHKGYYRDIIRDYSPAVLGYIDNLEFDKNKSIVATFLKLKNLKIIDIIEDEIQIINKEYNLEEHEKYLLENKENFSLGRYHDLIIKDSKEKGLIEVKKVKKNKIFMAVLLMILMPLLLFLLISTNAISNVKIGENFFGIIILICFIIVFLTLFMSPIIIIHYIAQYTLSSTLSSYGRAEKGEEINKMLEGLKNYIKDFSVLDQRVAKEIYLWEDYLIYSILFDQNIKIIKEFEKYIPKDIIAEQKI